MFILATNFLNIMLAIIGLSLYKFEKIFTYWIYLSVAIFSLLFVSREFYVGFDIEIYISYYREINEFDSVFNSSFSWKGDHFFFSVMYVFKSLGLSFYSYLLAFTSINLFLLYLFFKKFVISDICDKELRVLITVLWFLCLLSISSTLFMYGNVLRQGMALSISVCSLIFFSNKKYFFGFLLVFAALLTHKSSLFLFVAYLIANKSSSKMLFFITVTFIVIGKVGLLNIIGTLNIPFLSEKLLAYSELFLESETRGIKFILVLIVMSFLGCSLYIFDFAPKHRIVIKMSLLIGSFCVLFFSIGKLSERLILYFDFFTVASAAVIVCKFKPRLFALAISFFCILAYAAFVSFNASINTLFQF